jgi:hypothetical protein
MIAPSVLRRTILHALYPFLTLMLAGTCQADIKPALGLFEPMLTKASECPDAFPLVAGHQASPLLFDETEHKGVLRAIGDLQTDIQRVTGLLPESAARPTGSPHPVIIGTVGKSPRIDALLAAGKLDATQLTGKWESFVIATVADPMPGVPSALVIAGSDKRGTIYGLYELSRQIGVSPWYWWADVPVAHRDDLLLKPGVYASGEPSVKYRGIFINDEAPALRRWAQEKFGGMTPEFYRHVFELLLRCRANFLWPAMWLPTSFNDDFPENPRLADEYGIVMSTSHHEPMMRAHHEWTRYGKGPWNYETNADKLREFWKGGFERVKGFENVVTVGMRGDGDEAMSEGTAVPLLKGIIADQRRILSEVSGKPASQVPQLWALYKEVQDYYDKGMRVDDDILVLFSDDNWGNLRFLPRPEDRSHPGGFGMYYHVDYVGAPVSYRWLNVSQIERVWEQMQLSYAAGVHSLWILNVGDIKPMELPMSFFLDLAWKPEAIRAEDLRSYYIEWASQQFGPAQAKEIAELLALYTKYNARRTPEMLEGNTYSVANYREADRVVTEYQDLLRRARAVDAALPESQRDAFFQLVLYPIEACSTVTEMYVAAGKNAYYAERGASSANYYADKVQELFARDAELTRRFHEQLSGGKWNHMMSQTHLGYTYWNHPPLNRMPAVSYVQPVDKADLGFLVEQGQRPRWGWIGVEAEWDFPTELPRFDRINDPSYQIDIINRGRTPLAYSLEPRQDWIKLSKCEGTLLYNEPIQVSIDWAKAPEGVNTGEILLSGAGRHYAIKVPIRKVTQTASGFVEQDRVISIEAASFDRETRTKKVGWSIVPNLGRTGSAVTPAPFVPEQRLTLADAPCLEYDFTLLDDAKVTVHSYVSPTQDFRHGDGLRFAISIDDAPPQVVNLNEGEQVPDWKYPDWWNKSVADHIKVRRTEHHRLPAGKHTLKLWMIDAGVVVQKFVIDAGGLKPSYLGPPASRHLP